MGTPAAPQGVFAVGQRLNRAGDLFYQQWEVVAVNGPTITLTQDDGYAEVLADTALAFDLITPAPPAHYRDPHGNLWEPTLDGRGYRQVLNEGEHGPLESADWIQAHRAPLVAV